MREEKLPLVSICVPTYNCARFLEKSLDSIALQTYQNIEVIISDNASTDGTVAILKQYQRRFGWHLALNQVNVGPGNNFNRLIDLAQGDFVAIYHGDDIYHPDIVTEAVRVFAANPHVGIVGTLIREIDGRGKTIKEYTLPDQIGNLNKTSYSFDETLLGVLSSGNDAIFLATPSVMVRRSVYQKLGNFKVNDRYKSALDYEMWLRVASEYGVAIIDRQLMQYRIHENQGSELEIRKNIEVHDIVNVLQDHLENVQDKSIFRKACHFIDNAYISAAVRQNAGTRYAKSNESLSFVKARFSVKKLVLYVLNKCELNASSRNIRRLYGLLKLRDRP